MGKIRTFTKNYKKIIIVSLICLVLVAICSFFIQMISLRTEITETNNKQLEKINSKYNELSDNFDYLMNGTEKPVDRDLNAAYGVLSLEPDDAEDTGYLKKFVGNMTCADNLIILDKNRERVNATGELDSTDYRDSHYDKLFSGSEGKIVTVYSKGSNDEQTKGVKCGNYYLLIQTSQSEINHLNISQTEIWQLSRMSEGLDTNSIFVVVDQNDGSVVYKDKDELDIKSFDIEKDAFGNDMTGDGHYMVKYYDNDKEGVRLFALTPKLLVCKKNLSSMVLTVLVFVFAQVFLVAYIMCLRQDAIDPTYETRFLRKYFLKPQVSRFRTMVIVVGVLAAFIFMLLINVNNSRSTLTYLDGEADECVRVYDMYNKYADETVQCRNKTMYGHGRMASDFINRHTDYQNKKGMRKLADALDVDELTAVDDKGKTEFTSSPLDNLDFLADSKSSLYELRYALAGKEGVTVQGDGENMDDNLYIFAVPRRGDDEVADGIMAVIAKNGMSESVNDSVNQDAFSLLEDNRAKDDSKIFLVDNYGVVISGKKVNSDKEVDEDTLKNGFCGTLMINGEKCLSVVRYLESNKEYLYVIAPINWCSSYVLLSTLMFVVMYVMAALWMLYDGLGSKYNFEKRGRTIKSADDWKRTELYWEELTIGKKMSKIFSACIHSLTVILLVGLILVDRGDLDGGNLYMLITGSWNQSMNGYSILLNLGIMCFFFTGISFVDAMLGRIEKILGDSGVTGCRLAKSLVKYIGSMACVVIVLTNFGVDAVAALASVGIIGLALSFGAQELVKDMIAGMFLLFEGNFRVGDMLDVEGNWYWIKAIGVRTTKLEAWGSVKVVNNSNMTGIVNIQRASAVVNCDIWVDNRYDLDTVIEIFVEELPELRELFPMDVSTPVYKGIQEICAQRTLIRLRAYCPPLMQGYVGRELRYKVKHILDSHDIHLANDAYNVNVSSMESEEMKKEIDEYRVRMTGDKPE